VVHLDVDQFFRVESGMGEVHIDGRASKVVSDMAILVPAGARHNVVNTGTRPLKVYTLYAPPEHADATVHHRKAEAMAAHEHFTGHTTE
jgi:mannose-6-phosphate isomerase-like protein (cupin superfamily)